MTPEEFYNGILDFIENGNLNIVKKTKKGEKEMDLKPLIYEAHRGADGNGLFLQLSSGSAANVKPELVLEAYCKSLGKKNIRSSRSASIVRKFTRTRENMTL